MSVLIPEGHVLIAGRGRNVAIVALAAAEKAGLSASAVRTVTEGYIVPEKVAEEFTKLVDGEKKSTKSSESTEPEKQNPSANDEADAKAQAEADAKAADEAKAESDKSSTTKKK